MTIPAAHADRPSTAGARPSRLGVVTAGLWVLLVVTAAVSLCVGRIAVSPWELLATLAAAVRGAEAADVPPLVRTVVLDVRLPRVLVALAIGAGLSASGAAYQGVFRNPLVSPDILGVSAGAGLGAAIAILLSMPVAGIQALAFCSALAAVALTALIGSRCQRRTGSSLGLILGGIVVASIFSSFLSLSKLLADPDNKLPAITFWLMGSLSAVTLRDLAVLALPMIVSAGVLLRVRWYINVLSFGDDEARTLGANVRILRAAVIVASTVITASAVSVCGMVGWVGLMAPHIARMLVGPGYRLLLPAAMLVGGECMLVVDDLARSVASTEIPLGILTSLIGGPFFVWLMMRAGRQWD